MENVLEISNLTKKYGDFIALDDINFNIKKGDFVGLLGVNGAGKTSLISSISGINSFKGKIKINGYDVVDDVVLAKKSIGVVPQEIAFDPFLTVEKTLKLQAGLYGVSDSKDWVDEVVTRLHLKDKFYANNKALSGGMKRRLMVAQALIHKPPLIILDEPTAGVDIEIRKSLWQFISDLHKAGHTILLTTHYLEEVEQLCNNIIMLDKGRVIAKSSIHDLMSRSSSIPTTVTVEASSIPEELLNIVIKQESNNSWQLDLKNNDELLNILSTFKQSNIKLDNININKPSIEDVFISYLNRK